MVTAMEDGLEKMAKRALPFITPDDQLAAKDWGVPAYLLQATPEQQLHFLILKAANTTIEAWRSDSPDEFGADADGGFVIPTMQLPDV